MRKTSRMVPNRACGSPKIGHSTYSSGDLDALSVELTAACAAGVWYSFDNTAESTATANVLHMLGLVG